MIEFDVDALNECIAELSAVTEVGHPNEELLTAVNFVFQYGSFTEFLDEPDLTNALSWPGPDGAAWAMVGHWSVEREQTRHSPTGRDGCQVCGELETAAVYQSDYFDDGRTCNKCGGGLTAHALVYDEEPDPQMVCVGQWQRCEPEAFPVAGTFIAGQTGQAWAARWYAPLADGNFAVVTRHYFLSEDQGQLQLYRGDDYDICTDPADPEGTLVFTNDDLQDLDSDSPAHENLQQLATDSFPPEPGEWQKFVESSANFAVPVPA